MNSISKRAKVMSDKPQYEEKLETESGGHVWHYSKEHVEKRWKEKKEKIKKLENSIEKLRKQYDKDMSTGDLRTQAEACVVSILDDTAARIGNEESVKEFKTYGVSTLKVKHLTLKGSKAIFKFVGKDQVKQNIETSNSKTVKVLKELIKGKSGDDFIFEVEGKKIWDRAINRYLKDFGISAKDLRGFHSNRLMKEKLKKKDWKEALEEVAKIVGHEPATLKNQYLDPDLVKKYEKKADYSNILSKRAADKPKVDINRNVNNISSSAKLNDTLLTAWKIIAPFLQDSANVSGGTRTRQDQSNIITWYWNNIVWEHDPKQSMKTVPFGSGFFVKNYGHLVNKSKKALTQQFDIMTKTYEPTAETMANGGPASRLVIAPPGQSEHESGNAMDISGVGAVDAQNIIKWVAKRIPEFLTITRMIPEDQQQNLHLEIGSAIYPGPENMEKLLLKFFHNIDSEKMYVSQEKENDLVKHARLDADLQEYASYLKNKYHGTVGKTEQKTPAKKLQPDQARSLRINPGVKTNTTILSAWQRLFPYLPENLVLTSGERTPEDQTRIIYNFWNKLPAYARVPGASINEMVKIINQHGYVVGPPETNRPQAHLKGNSFDISGRGIDVFEVAQRINELSQQNQLGVNLRAQPEERNNAVHVNIIASIISKRAETEEEWTEEDDIEKNKMMETLYEDMAQSDIPKEILESFSPGQFAKDNNESNKYQREKDDPKWDEVLIDKDGTKLTRKQIRDHYVKNKDRIMKEISGKPVMLFIGTKKNENILKRNHNDKQIIITNADQDKSGDTDNYFYWADRRMISVHRVIEKETDLGWVDLDLHGDYSLSDANKYAKAISDAVKKELGAKTITYSSGGTGLHVEIYLTKKQNVDTLRDKLKDMCEILNKDFPGATTGVVKGTGMRTDVTTLKENGNLRVPYALHEVYGGVKQPQLSKRADIDIGEPEERDIGFGVDDNVGDFFEKEPMFVDRTTRPEYEIHDVGEENARELSTNDPTKYFYQGLHKNYPKFEVAALKNMLKENAKFYFVFKYNDREEPEFKEMMQEAAEKLSQQDVRAFFYYQLHKIFPELGRGAIINLIDTNPESFHEFGLGSDYPDYLDAANNARNLKDPSKVDVEKPIVRTEALRLSKRAEEMYDDSIKHSITPDEVTKIYEFEYKLFKLKNLDSAKHSTLNRIVRMEGDLSSLLKKSIVAMKDVYQWWIDLHKQAEADPMDVLEEAIRQEPDMKRMLEKAFDHWLMGENTRFNRVFDEINAKIIKNVWSGPVFGGILAVSKELQRGASGDVGKDMALFQKALTTVHQGGPMMNHFAGLTGISKSLLDELTSGKFIDTWDSEISKFSSLDISKRASLKIDIDPEEQKIFDLLLEVKKYYKLPVELRVVGGWVRDKLIASGIRNK